MRSGRDRAAAAGYSLVVVTMLITVMSILVAAVLPLWSAQVKRDKEEELISRGMQYAEAIRVFQRRFGRLPVRLEELIEVEPRSIRRLWEDPMTGTSNWVRIFEGVPPGGLPVDPETGEPMPDPDGDGIPGEGETTYIGPIRGVRSSSTDDGFQVLFGQTGYNTWEFRSDLFARFRAAPSENGVPRVNNFTIGRPFRYGTPVGMPPQQSPPGALQTMPGGSPGQRPPPGTRPPRPQGDRPK
jgi:type II secretory pathway pseudopilin PulG